MPLNWCCWCLNMNVKCSCIFSGRKIARKSCGIRSPPSPRTQTWWWVGWVRALEVRSTCPQSHPLRWGCHPRSRLQGCQGVQEELRASQGETRPTDHLQMHDLSEKHTSKGHFSWAQPICQNGRQNLKTDKNDFREIAIQWHFDIRWNFFTNIHTVGRG